jgi:hypothetical protein
MWTTEQAFAVFQMVDDLREAIWHCAILSRSRTNIAISSSLSLPTVTTKISATRRSDPQRTFHTKTTHRQSPLVYPKHSAIFVRIVSAAQNSPPAVSLAEDGVSVAERGWQQRAISDAFRAPISSDSQA